MGKWRCGVVAEKRTLSVRRLRGASRVTEHEDTCAITFCRQAARWETAAVFIELSQRFVEIALDTCALSGSEQAQFVAE